MLHYHRQERTEPDKQQEHLPHKFHGRRYPSLWLSCEDPVMDRALASLKDMNPDLVIQTHRPLLCKHSQVDDVTLDLIETAVRHRRIVQIIVFGHAGCSSAQEPIRQINTSGTSSFQKMLSAVRSREESNREGKRQVLENIRALQQSPLLGLAQSRRELTIHGLFYFAESGLFNIFNYQSGKFVPAAL
jgi:carbonic anhydrase